MSEISFLSLSFGTLSPKVPDKKNGALAGGRSDGIEPDLKLSQRLQVRIGAGGDHDAAQIGKYMVGAEEHRVDAVAVEEEKVCVKENRERVCVFQTLTSAGRWNTNKRREA